MRMEGNLTEITINDLLVSETKASGTLVTFFLMKRQPPDKI